MRDLSDTYSRDFVLRKTGGNSQSYEVTIPREIVERCARKHNIPLEKVRERLKARVLYDDFGFDGVVVKFIEKGAE